MNNDQVNCGGCGKIYYSTSQIKTSGGVVYQLGLAMKAKCVCGSGLGNVGRLWKYRETIEMGSLHDGKKTNK